MFFLNILLLFACVCAPQIIANNQISARTEKAKPIGFVIARRQTNEPIVLVSPAGFSGNLQRITSTSGNTVPLFFHDEEGNVFAQQQNEQLDVYDQLANSHIEMMSARQVSAQDIGPQNSTDDQFFPPNPLNARLLLDENGNTTSIISSLMEQERFDIIDYFAQHLQPSKLFLVFDKTATAELVRQLNQNTSNASIISILTDLIARTPRYRLACISSKRRTSFDTATLRELLRIAANNTNLGFFKNLLESRLTNAKYGCLFRD